MTRASVADSLRVLEDRKCRALSLRNPIRRWLSPPSREVERLDPRPGHRVVDLGAGVGYYAPEILHRIGPEGRLVLLDVDAENLEFAGRDVGSDPRVTILVGSATEATAIESGSADRVLMSLVICCLVDKRRALGEAWRILRPGGRLLVTYPRRRLPGGRGAGLRVTPEIWGWLRRDRPWTYLRNPRSWWVERHLLERPAGSLATP